MDTFEKKNFFTHLIVTLECFMGEGEGKKIEDSIRVRFRGSE